MIARPVPQLGWGLDRKCLGNGVDLVSTTFSHETLVHSDDRLNERQLLANAMRDLRDDIFPDSLASRFWRFISDQFYDWL